MKTLDWFSSNAIRLGFNISTIDLDALLLKNSTPYEQNHSQSFLVSTSLKQFRLKNCPVLDSPIEFYISTETDKDKIIDPVNLVSHELFDANDLAFVQTEPIAIDPSQGIYQLLTDLETSPQQYMFFVGHLVDESAVLTSFAFAKDMQNPIKEYKKGPIEVKTRSLLETMLMQEKLASRNGENLHQIDVTRYSTGVTKGERDGI